MRKVQITEDDGKFSAVCMQASATLQGRRDRVVWWVQKTVEKVMACHEEASDARFLIKDGPKVTKLLMQYVQRMTA